MPLGAVGATYGLLKLPKMPELKNRDLSDFPKIEDLDFNAIPYRDKIREEHRLKKLKQFNQTGKYIVYVNLCNINNICCKLVSKYNEKLFEESQIFVE